MRNNRRGRQGPPSRSAKPVAGRGPERTDRPKNRESVPKGRIVIGHHALKEVLTVRPAAVTTAWALQDWESSKDLRDLVEQFPRVKSKLELKPSSALERFGGHQGMVFFVDGEPEMNWDKIESAPYGVTLILDGIEDPHNLGAILRTSWLMGVNGVLAPSERSVGLTPSVHKVACGGVEHVPVETHGNFTQPIQKLKDSGYWVFGLSHKAKKTLFDLKMPEKIAWAIGSEERGLRSTTEKVCDELISIPQLAASASYNASVATAIALSETFRQHSTSKKHK